ncbi:hypothetical protein BGX24_000658 [Mortierella sp. AD032]|nr:hypothetical protein BGX24_000658 [Mortierella sp. AD032]
MHPPTPTITGTKGPSQTPLFSFMTPLSQDTILTTPSSTRMPSLVFQNTDQQTVAATPTIFQEQLQPDPCHCDFEAERQKHLRQNSEIIRIIALKSIQIRRSEAAISQLERANIGLTVALNRVQKELQEQSSLNTALRQHSSSHMSATTNNILQEEWIQLDQTQELIPHLRQQVELELATCHQKTSCDTADCELDHTNSGDLMLSFTPRSKKRKLKSLMVLNVIPRDVAMLKLEHIRAIYEHEQDALVEMMRSHRSTTELYKETLRKLSEDRVSASNSNVHITNMNNQVFLDASNGGLSQPMHPLLHCAEEALLPSDRSIQESTAQALTPPNLNRTRVQQTPSPSPFFNIDTVPDVHHDTITNSQESDVVFEDTATVMSTPPRPVVPPPAYVRPTNYHDLIVGNQKRQATPSTQKSPRKQSSFSPYRRQTPPATSKGSPSAEAIRDRYVQERAKAKVQSKNLVAKFKNNGTGTGASEVAGASSSAKSKEGDAAINCTLKQAEKAKTETDNGTIGLTTSTPSTSISTTTTLDDFIVRTPSRIPRAISSRHRSMSSNMNVKRQTIPCSEKLKHLTANQLLRRMNKSLLGTSRPPNDLSPFTSHKLNCKFNTYHDPSLNYHDQVEYQRNIRSKHTTGNNGELPSHHGYDHNYSNDDQNVF